MKASKKELVIGVCAVIALCVLFFGIDYLKGVNIFKPTNYYYATYTNVAGLQVSAPVTVNGFKVGQVRNINYEYNNPGHVKVEIGLDKELRVPKGSKAVIESDLLGTATVVLHMAPTTDYQDRGTEIAGETASGMMDNVSQNLLPNVSAIFPKVDSLLTALNTLVRDPAISQSVNRLDAITLNLEQTMRKLNTTTGQLSPVMTNVNGITSNLNTITSDLTEVSAELKRMPIDSTMNNILALSNNLRTLSAELNNPNSSIGALTHDRQLYDNLNNCAASLDSLLIDVKKNPKRYISIKLL